MLINCFFLSILFLGSCNFSYAGSSFSRERDKITTQVLMAFTKAMKSKELVPAGLGEGIDHSTGKQKYLKVIFQIDHLPDVEAARNIIVDVIEEFLDFINSKEGIQEYLVEYPFSINFIEVGIISPSEGTGLFSVSNYKNELNYRKHDPKCPKAPAVDIHTETYEEALEIVRKGQE